jgi:DNA-binding FrmR family transcriptional regulator
MLLKHLKRIEGQVRGTEKMLVAGRDGESLVTRCKPDMGLYSMVV